MSNEIKQQRDRFMGFSFAAADLLIELDEQCCITFCMGASQNLFGATAEQLLKQPFNRFVSNADKTVLTFLFDSLKEGQRKGPLKIHVLKNDIKTPVQVSIFKMPGGDNTINLAINDLDPLALNMNDPNRDNETGLLTKDAFFNTTEATISNAKNLGNQINMTLIDMPNQEDLEFQMGEENAEEFKNKAASFLRAVSVGDSAAKITNDKFSIIHPNGLESDHISQEIENISKEFNDGTQINIGSNTLEIDTEVNATDMASALAYTINQYVSDNNNGIGKSASFEKQVNSQITTTIDQIKWFKNVIKKNQIGYVAQEIVSIKQQKIHHYELLVRFEKDVSPFQRLVFAEKVGIIHELDLVILGQAIKWINKTPNHPNFSLAVNISGASVARADFCFKMLKLITEELHFPKRLLIEITESAEIESLRKVNEFFKNIRAKGIKLCIDDFGAGAASLNYLRLLDVDIVKIDGAYIRESMKSGREDKILKAMVQLCKSMKMEVVAEQIETPEQAKYLNELGVDFGQGYLYHRPSPVKGIMDNLGKDKSKTA